MDLKLSINYIAICINSSSLWRIKKTLHNQWWGQEDIALAEIFVLFLSQSPSRVPFYSTVSNLEAGPWLWCWKSLWACAGSTFSGLTDVPITHCSQVLLLSCYYHENTIWEGELLSQNPVGIHGGGRVVEGYQSLWKTKSSQTFPWRPECTLSLGSISSWFHLLAPSHTKHLSACWF